MNSTFKLFITLFFLGFIGILTLLLVEFPLDQLPKEVAQKFSPHELKMLSLVNPTILLLLATFVGARLYKQVGLSVPTLMFAIFKEKPHIRFEEQLKFGVLLGAVSGIGLLMIALAFRQVLVPEFLLLESKIKLNPIMRLLYGGVTEEILIRFGVMTLIVWIIYKMSSKLMDSSYWIGIVLSSLIFAFSHFPIVFNAVPAPSFLLLLYILLGNGLAGVLFGWLYWKKGLEAGMVAHLFSHLTVMLFEFASS